MSPTLQFLWSLTLKNKCMCDHLHIKRNYFSKILTHDYLKKRFILKIMLKWVPNVCDNFECYVNVIPYKFVNLI